MKAFKITLYIQFCLFCTICSAAENSSSSNLFWSTFRSRYRRSVSPGDVRWAESDRVGFWQLRQFWHRIN